MPLYLAVPDPASLATVGLAISHAYVPSVSPTQTLTLLASVSAGLAKLAAKGVGDLRSARAARAASPKAPTPASPGPDNTREAATASSSASTKE